MANDTFDIYGLQVQTLNDLLSGLQANFQSIYGSDISIASNDPDGEMLNIFAQAGTDIRTLIQKINSSFDPEQCEGVIQDQRYAINGIERNGASFTLQPIDVVISQGLSLQGLDSESQQLTPDNLPYTIQDDAGNQYYLNASFSCTGAGTYSLLFRAANIGLVQSTLNTITVPVTIIAGITSVNNSSGPTTIGQNEESDFQFRNRRRVSVAISSEANIDSLTAALNNLAGVVGVQVMENYTGSTDANGVPAHCVWCIVEGASDNDIAVAILSKKSPGCNMKGSVSVNVAKQTGGFLTAYFDRPINQNLYVKFSLLYPNGTIDKNYVAAQIAKNITFNPGGQASGDIFTDYVKEMNKNYVITGMLLSTDNINWYEVVTTTTPQYQFILSTTRITIS